MTFLWWPGFTSGCSGVFHGHWLEGWHGSHIGEISCKPGACSPDTNVSYRWGGAPVQPEKSTVPPTLKQIMQQVVAPLDPTELVLNCGLWGASCCPIVNRKWVRMVAHATQAGIGIHGRLIWKTTSAIEASKSQTPFARLRTMPHKSAMALLAKQGWKIWDVGPLTRRYSKVKALYWNRSVKLFKWMCLAIRDPSTHCDFCV